MTDEQFLESMEWYLTVAQKCGSATLSKEEFSGLCDLIKRQKTEIDILIRKKETLKDEIAEKDAEIDRLRHTNKLISKNAGSLLWHLEQAKSEAYREFADGVYKFLCNKQNWNVFKEQWLENGECSWLKENINNLVKELTEGGNEDGMD